MPKLLEHKDGKYRLYATETQSNTTGWMTKEDLMRYLFYQYEYDFKLRVIETFMSFPFNWTDADTFKLIMNNKDGKNKFLNWHMRALKNPRLYYKKIDKKIKAVFKVLNKFQ